MIEKQDVFVNHKFQRSRPVSKMVKVTRTNTLIPVERSCQKKCNMKCNMKALIFILLL